MKRRCKEKIADIDKSDMVGLDVIGATCIHIEELLDFTHQLYLSFRAHFTSRYPHYLVVSSSPRLCTIELNLSENERCTWIHSNAHELVGNFYSIHSDKQFHVT